MNEKLMTLGFAAFAIWGIAYGVLMVFTDVSANATAVWALIAVPATLYIMAKG